MLVFVALVAAIIPVGLVILGVRWYALYRDKRGDRHRKALYRDRERHWFAQNLFFFRRTQRRLTHRGEPPGQS